MSPRANPSAERDIPTSGRRWLATPGRRVLAALAVVVIVGGVVVGVTDPFASSGRSGSGVVDNSYPTGLATVREQALSSQTQVDASLGYSGTYDVAIPSGTATAAVTQDRSALEAAQQRLADDELSLASARRLQRSSGTATILAARSTVRSDEVALSLAKTMLTADERLSCPVASDATVTTPLGSSSAARAGGDPSDDSSPADDQTVTPAAPVATVGSATTVSQTSETLSGTVDPGDLDTTYYFEWGTTSSFGSQTATADAGDGTSPVPVTATISGLQPDTTYGFTLVATNADGSSVAPAGTFATAESSCVAETKVISEDDQAIIQDKDALAADEVNNKSTLAQAESTVATDRASVAAAEAALAADEAEATNPGSVFTALPSLGARISRGESVYSLNGRPVPLLYGTVTLYRALYRGESDGPDVTELNDNLSALGFGEGLRGSPQFSAATTAAVEAWQRSLGLPASGIVDLGDVVVEPGPIRVTEVTAALGGAAQPGMAVLAASSTARVVTIDLDVSLEPDVRVGDTVGITLPNNETTPGVVISVGKVATSSSSGATGQSGPTVTVLVTPLHQAATGLLDQASVEVEITTASVARALVVPVDALLALAGGGYAVEEVSPRGVHHLVAVSLGIFDDADGIVQVTGSGLAAGQRVVVPAL
jgi:hypothetical protein